VALQRRTTGHCSAKVRGAGHRQGVPLPSWHPAREMPTAPVFFEHPTHVRRESGSQVEASPAAGSGAWPRRELQSRTQLLGVPNCTKAAAGRDH
jgi:uncharacterized protein (DUF3084 family)